MSLSNFEKDDNEGIKAIVSATWEDTPLLDLKENGTTWKDPRSKKFSRRDIPKLEKLVRDKNDISAKAILDLIKKIKGQEERFKKQAEELESIKIDSKKIIENLETRTKVLISDMDRKVSFWHYLIIGVLLVVGIGFVLNLFDIWNYRVTYFQEHKNRVEKLEKQVLFLEDKIKYETVMKSEKDELNGKISEYQVIIDCLKDKKYWQYEQCF